MPKPQPNQFKWISNGVLKQAQSLGFTVEELQQLRRTGAGGKFTFADLNRELDARLSAAKAASSSVNAPAPAPTPEPPPAPTAALPDVGDEFSTEVRPDQMVSKIPIAREVEPPPPDVTSATPSPNGGAPIADVTQVLNASAIDATADELAVLGRVAFERIGSMLIAWTTKQDFAEINAALKADKEEAAVVQMAMAKAIRHNNIQVSPNTELIVALAMIYGTKAADVLENQKNKQNKNQKSDDKKEIQAQLEAQKNTATAIYKKLEEVAAVAERLQIENEKLKTENLELLDQATKPSVQP